VSYRKYLFKLVKGKIL